MDGWISIHPFWDRWLEIQPTPGGISIQWMDFHPVVGIPSILDGFPTAWMEIQPLGLVCLDVVVKAWEISNDMKIINLGSPAVTQNIRGGRTGNLDLEAEWQHVVEALQ